jgi:N-acetylglucosaminyldiphosphoundecaprenol N-acetyl-beta-D-mannosaminyltransferase
MPLVWASRLSGEPLPARVAGVDLVAECARLSAQEGYRLFLLGAGPGVAEHAAAVLRRRYPTLVLAGTYAPPGTSPAQDAVTIERVRAAAPDILLVAFGAPRQDYWIRGHRDILGVPVCIGVGGSFDLLSGRISRAPSWMQGSGLEWLYRLGREPKRLWKRYFVHDLPVFVRLMLSAGIRSMAAPLAPTRVAQRAEAAGAWSASRMAPADVSQHSLHG